ncbi:hypothetical protein N0V92_009708, partial [Colletotrichum tropicale]
TSRLRRRPPWPFHPRPARCCAASLNDGVRSSAWLTICRHRRDPGCGLRVFAPPSKPFAQSASGLMTCWMTKLCATIPS